MTTTTTTSTTTTMSTATCFDSMDAARSLAVAEGKHQTPKLPGDKLNLKTRLAARALRWKTCCRKRPPLPMRWPG